VIDAGDVSSSSTLDGWLTYLARVSPGLGEWLQRPFAEQERLGYGRTLRPILEQPYAWEKTALDMVALRSRLLRFLSEGGLSAGQILLTGFGSGAFVGQCLERELMRSLRIPVRAVAGEAILADLAANVPPIDPTVVVAFCCSSKDKEARAVVERVAAARPRSSHILICFRASGEPRRVVTASQNVLTLSLHQRRAERGQGLTSTFTNLVLAGAFLGRLGTAEDYTSLAICSAAVARGVLDRSAGPLIQVARSGFRDVVFLGAGDREGAARDAASRMRKMTSGKVHAWADTPTALRYGLMETLGEDTLPVAFLSPASPARDVELDLLLELDRRKPSRPRVIVGEAVPAELRREPGVVIDRAGVGRGAPPLIELLTGQLLGVFRCLHEGLRPDTLPLPAAGGGPDANPLPVA